MKITKTQDLKIKRTNRHFKSWYVEDGLNLYWVWALNGVISTVRHRLEDSDGETVFEKKIDALPSHITIDLNS